VQQHGLRKDAGGFKGDTQLVLAIEDCRGRQLKRHLPCGTSSRRHDKGQNLALRALVLWVMYITDG
jgi:hypothetical protein